MGSLSSGPTTNPGPSVGGPPENNMILAPVFGKADYHQHRAISSEIKGTYLEKRNCNTHGNTSTPQRPLVLLDRPWIPLQTFENVCQLELARLDGEQEFRCSGCGHRLTRSRLGHSVRRV